MRSIMEINSAQAAKISFWEPSEPRYCGQSQSLVAQGLKGIWLIAYLQGHPLRRHALAKQSQLTEPRGLREAEWQYLTYGQGARPFPQYPWRISYRKGDFATMSLFMGW